MSLGQYFDRVEIIHLPERQDRYDALALELRALGLAIDGAKVRVPHAPRPADANGFPSRGVYGNFLSHLSIIRAARDDGLRNVLVLEDDAIFSRRMARHQPELVRTLQEREWDLCFFGHSLKRELRGHGRGLVPHDAGFIWAHCYAVNARVYDPLIRYLELTMARPAGHPLGGRMYIDAAFTMFRQQHPQAVTLVANPVLSVQRGSPSSIAGTGWYRSLGALAPLIQLGRSARDQWWRITA